MGEYCVVTLGEGNDSAVQGSCDSKSGRWLQPFKTVLRERNRAYFVVMCLDVKNQPTAINICYIVSLDASIVRPREVVRQLISGIYARNSSENTLRLYNNKMWVRHLRGCLTIFYVYSDV